MKYFNPFTHGISGLLLAAALAFGCGCRKAGEPAAVSEAAAKLSMTSAFAAASPEVKTLADDAAAALATQDSGRAFLQLSALTSRPDLTTEQRTAATESMMLASQRLRDAVAKGDKDAAKLLEDYRASK